MRENVDAGGQREWEHTSRNLCKRAPVNNRLLINAHRLVKTVRALCDNRRVNNLILGGSHNTLRNEIFTELKTHPFEIPTLITIT